MKPFDLESSIRRLRVPEREPDYWEGFPAQVMRELHRGGRTAGPNLDSGRTAFSYFGPMALACVMLAFCLWQSRMPVDLTRMVLRNDPGLRASLRRFECKLGLAMTDAHGHPELMEDPP